MSERTPTLVKSRIVYCGSCGRWLWRAPYWGAEMEGKGHQCWHCGATSVRVKEGRPYGPRSRHWGQVLQDFHWLDETLRGDPWWNDSDDGHGAVFGAQS